MRGMLRWGLVVLLVAVVLGGCSDDDPAVDDDGGEAADTTEAPEAQIAEVSVDAEDYSYSMPEEVTSGLVEFTMTNVGKELHIAALARIDEGKTFADAARELQSASPAADPVSEEVGGVASTSPGSSSRVILELEPGSYFFACFIPAADGTPHVAKGMVQPFEVKENGAELAEPPAAAGVVTAKDFSYDTSYEATPGEQVIELRNEGGQSHEITLLEFDVGKGPGDLAPWFAKPEGPPPATFFGGPVIAKGEAAFWTTPPLVAGKSYFFMCLIPDPADGVPHAAKGMLLPVAVT